MRDNGICRCGGVKTCDKVELHVEHKIPVEFDVDNSE